MPFLFQFVFLLCVCISSHYSLFLCSQDLHLVQASGRRVNNFSTSLTAPVFAPSTTTFDLNLFHSVNGHFCWLLSDVQYGIQFTRKNKFTQLVTHREAVCGPEIHSIFDAWHYEVLWTCAHTRTVLYKWYMMTSNCTRFYETRECQRPDSWGQFFLTCNAMERGRAGGIMPLGKYFLHI
jgi:hypothetical protein